MTRANAWAVVMAGGSGTRFWPLSRKNRPKQLLPLGKSGKPLLAETVERISPLIPKERVLIVTAERLLEATRSVLPGVPEENFLGEPTPRNTAPCVGWAASVIARRDPNAVIAVLAADHHIEAPEAFLQVVEHALDAASNGDLVTIGIKPTRPETGYGYLEIGEPLGGADVRRVARFVEKPDAEHAQAFVEGGRHAWNSGMFFFRADAIRRAIEAHLPELAAGLERFEGAGSAESEATVVREQFGELPSISVDNGIMERADRVAMVQGDFGWSDVGSWTTAYELAPKDAYENAARRSDVLVDSERCYVRSKEGKTVALVGVSDLVVVDTEDALLILPRDRAQDVRAIVAQLTKDKREEML